MKRMKIITGYENLWKGENYQRFYPYPSIEFIRDTQLNDHLYGDPYIGYEFYLNIFIWHFYIHIEIPSNGKSKN